MEMSPKKLIKDEDCKEIISKTIWKDNEYISHQLIPFIEGRTGVLGEHYKLKIKLKDTPEEPRFFVKFIPKLTNRKEEGFYEKILPNFLKYEIVEIKNVVPRCYSVKQFDYIVLEDLAVQGFKTVNSRTPLAKCYILCALQALASYHSASIIYEMKKREESGVTFNMLQHFQEELKEIYYTGEKDVRQAIRSTIEPLIDLFGEVLHEHLAKDAILSYLLSIFDGMKSSIKPSEKHYNVICHGDLWQPNLMFSLKDDIPEKCILIDQQMIRYSPPAQDVMSLLFLTTNRELRKTHLDNLLDSYYSFLQKTLYKYELNCEMLISKEEFLSSCESHKPFATMQAFSYAQVAYIPTESFEKFMGQEREKMEFLFENRTPMVLKFCEEDSIYREKMRECIQELVECVQ